MTQGNQDSPKILVVDDDPLNLKTTCHILETAKYNIKQAVNGKDALQLALTFQPDLFILDYILPDINGLEVCQKIKSHPLTANAFVVILSGMKIDMDSQIEGLELGADEYLVRPLPSRELLARVAILLRIKQTEDALRISETRFRELFNHINSGMAIFQSNSDNTLFTVVDINQAGSRINRVAKKDALNLTVQELFSGAEETGLVDAFHEVWRTGKPTYLPATLYREKRFAYWAEHQIYKLPSGEMVTIFDDVSNQIQTIAQSQWEAEVNTAVARLSKALIYAGTLEDISYLVLETAKELTTSAFGYVAYIQEETGYLICPTMTRDIWDMCQITDKTIVFEQFGGLFGWVLKNKTSLLTNKPQSDPRSSGTPLGHVSIERFLSVPAMYDEGLVGQISLANPSRNYDHRDLKLLEKLADLYSLAVQRQRSAIALQNANERLRTSLEEQTRALEEMRRQLEETAVTK